MSQIQCTAIYARSLTGMQSRASIDDQIRKCRQYAEVHDLEILDEHIYREEAVSGVGADRPALKRVLQLAFAVSPPFHCVPRRRHQPSLANHRRRSLNC